MSEDSVPCGLLVHGAETGSPSPCPSPPVSTTPIISAAPLTPTSEHSAAGSSSSGRSEIRAPQRPRLTQDQLDSMSQSELLQCWKDLEAYSDWMEGQTSSQEVEIGSLRAYLDRAKQQHIEACSRERAVLRRLATKEQEIQDFVAQINELKSSATPTAGSLRSALLDPTVNLLLQKLRNELTHTRTQLEETQNELSAWKFTPDSNTGKRLMAKCRLLYQENEELGRVVSSGRMAKLEGELALQKSFSQEVKKSQSELDEFLQELDEDVEGMQSTVYYLQQELRKSRETITSLEHELRKYRKPKQGEKLKRRVINDEGEEVEEELEEDVEEDQEEQDQIGEEEDEGECVDADALGEEEVVDERLKEWTNDDKESNNCISNHAENKSNPQTTVNNGTVCLKRTKSCDDFDDSCEMPFSKKPRTNSIDADNDRGDTALTNGTNDSKSDP